MKKYCLIFLILISIDATANHKALPKLYKTVNREIFVVNAVNARQVAYENLRRYCQVGPMISSASKAQITKLRLSGNKKGMPVWTYQGYCIYTVR
jgi:hypothetical protein